MSGTSWHPIRDGLSPIIKALEWFQNYPIQELPNGVLYAAYSPSIRLSDQLNGIVTGRDPFAAGRVEVVRRWLAFHKHESEAKELSERISNLLSHTKEWEANARIVSASHGMSWYEWREQPYGEVGTWFGEDVTQAWWELMDDCWYVEGFVRQLAAMLGGTLKPKNPPNKEEWLSLAAVARGLGFGTQSKPDSKQVSRLIVAGELKDNGETKRKRKVSRSSVNDYIKRKLLEWDESAAFG